MNVELKLHLITNVDISYDYANYIYLHMFLRLLYIQAYERYGL